MSYSQSNLALTGRRLRSLSFFLLGVSLIRNAMEFVFLCWHRFQPMNDGIASLVHLDQWIRGYSRNADRVYESQLEPGAFTLHLYTTGTFVTASK